MACRIKLQNVRAGAFAVPMWFCEEHRIPCEASDTTCAVGRVEEVADSAVARIEMAVAEALVKVKHK